LHKATIPWSQYATYHGALTTLSITASNISGIIASTIGNLPNLKALVLDDNRLVGRIPPEIVELQNLEVFSIKGNGNLMSSLPIGLGMLTKMRVL
jgi:Leucine-rich repeat (LRR) protein